MKRPLLLLLLSGCSVLAPDPANRVLEGDDEASITLGELELRTKNFADRYVEMIADAVEDIKERTDSLRARREAHTLKLHSGTSAWDVVTSSHPLQEMLDLFVQVELQVMIWADEGLATRKFGEDGGGRISRALRSAREEILSLAGRALKRKQIGDIQGIIRDWRKRNPSVETGAFVRFGPYLEAPGGTLVTQLLSGFGILDLSRLNPLDPAAKEVGRVGNIADDALYMAKRFPMILRWQAEAVTFEALTTVESASKEAEGTLKTAEPLLKNATEAAKALEGAFNALAKITNPEKKEDEPKKEGPPGRRFDIREYESAVAQLARTARETRGLLEDVEDLAGSPAIAARMRDVGVRIERILAQLLVEALLLLVVFFVLLALYRALSVHLRARHERR